MSRVYTEKVVFDVAAGTAAYINSFARSLASTRVTTGFVPAPGTSLLDLFLNLFDTSDPYTPEEVEITATWSVATEMLHADDYRGFKLHIIRGGFLAQWPPPAIWAETVDWHPLPQNNPRHRRKCVNVRSRKAGASSGE